MYHHQFRGTFIYAASLPSVCEVLKKYEDEFFDVVDAKHKLLKLERKGVITENVQTQISAAANDDDAKEILYKHLKQNCNAYTLKTYCEVALTADGLPNMKELAKKMMLYLQQGGLF